MQKEYKVSMLSDYSAYAKNKEIVTMAEKNGIYDKFIKDIAEGDTSEIVKFFSVEDPDDIASIDNKEFTVYYEITDDDTDTNVITIKVGIVVRPEKEIPGDLVYTPQPKISGHKVRTVVVDNTLEDVVDAEAVTEDIHNIVEE